jgi:hypothetical protein
MMPPLHEWETFYVIIGSSAAALTGLQFVVIALGADTMSLAGEAEVQTFATPTIVHFSTVLLISAMISTPGQTQYSLSWCVLTIGMIGSAYACWIAWSARRTKNYTPVFEDWLFHAILPLFAYGCLFLTGLEIRWRPLTGLYFVAVLTLLLLFVGIHNAWDAATYMAMRKRDRP